MHALLLGDSDIKMGIHQPEFIPPGKCISRLQHKYLSLVLEGFVINIYLHK